MSARPFAARDARPSAAAPISRFRGVQVTPFRRLAFFVTIDAALVLAAFVAAVALRAEPARPVLLAPGTMFLGGLSVLATVGFLYVAGVYRVSWSFFALRDVVRLGGCVGYATALAGAVVLLGSPTSLLGAFPRSAVLIAAPLSFLLLAGFRLSRRVWTNALVPQSSKAVPTLLVGAGEVGEQVLRSILETSARDAYLPVGFVDDEPMRQGTTIHDVPVLGGLAAVPAVLTRFHVGVVLVTLDHPDGAAVRRVLEAARAADVADVRVAPALVAAGRPATLQSTREVGLDHLLGRQVVDLDLGAVHASIRGKRVLVTGGAGTIGAELCRQVARAGPAQLLVLDVDESRLHDLVLEVREGYPATPVRPLLVDVRDADRVAEVLSEARPDVVLHAAAYKHVPMLESWPLEGLAVNVVGTANVLRAAEAAGTQAFVLISTDKAVEPCSVMGATKRLAELVVIGHAARGPMRRCAVRFGNVLGSRGSVIPIFERQLRNGGPLTVTHPDMERYFMTTAEAVSLVLQAAALGERDRVYLLDIGQPVRIVDMAREFVRLHGLRPDVDVPIVFTGLRPGERLREKFVHENDALLPTAHPQVRAVPEAGALPADALDRARKVVASGDQAEARAYLRAMFPAVPAHAPLPLQSPPS